MIRVVGFRFENSVRVEGLWVGPDFSPGFRMAALVHGV